MKIAQIDRHQAEPVAPVELNIGLDYYTPTAPVLPEAEPTTDAALAALDQMYGYYA